jgi:hypothetical protein
MKPRLGPKGAPSWVALISLAQLSPAVTLLAQELGSEKKTRTAYRASLSEPDSNVRRDAVGFNRTAHSATATIT